MTLDWDEPMFEAALKQAAEGIIEAAEVRLSADQLWRLIDVIPKDHEHPWGRVGRVNLRGATLIGFGLGFSMVTFSGTADFSDATFTGFANFLGATFRDNAIFGGATFTGSAAFSHATFSRDAWFDGATFRHHGDFNNATFSRDARFDGTTFADDASFNDATFSGGAYFREATVGRSAHFFGATLGGDARFDDATVGDSASFYEATFERARQFGPLFVCGMTLFDRAVFEQPVRIELSARYASYAGAAFRGGADLFLRWAEVSLEDADFAETSLVAGLPPRLGKSPRFRKGHVEPIDFSPPLLGWEEPADDGTWHCQLTPPHLGGAAVVALRPRTDGIMQLRSPPDGPREFAPRVVSLRRAKVSPLTLSGVDLRACRFVGAHGLDELKLEGARFAYPPDGWRRTRRWRRARWTRRQTVAEERQWRDSHDTSPRGAGSPHSGVGWYESEVRAPDWLPDASQPPDPQQIASVYRALRKGREDSKDEPGAADFYYGEMEMRRHTTRNPASRRPIVSIVWLYWLLSGYGLRASRALIALAVTIALGAVCYDLFGFDAGKSPDDGTLVFAAESSVSLFRAPDTTNLTAWGHVIQMILRLAGPLFFGLALLALRGRVKR